MSHEQLVVEFRELSHAIYPDELTEVELVVLILAGLRVRQSVIDRSSAKQHRSAVDTNRENWATRAADALHRVRTEPLTDDQIRLLALALESVLPSAEPGPHLRLVR